MGSSYMDLFFQQQHLSTVLLRSILIHIAVFHGHSSIINGLKVICQWLKIVHHLTLHSSTEYFHLYASIIRNLCT